MNAGASWAACDADDIQSTQKLLRAAVEPCHRDDDLVMPRGGHLPERHTSGALRLTFDSFDGAALAHPVCWPDSEATSLDGPWMRMLVQRSCGETLAGLILRCDRVYRWQDVHRALESAFETGLARAGRYAVLKSRRLSAGRPVRLRVKPASSVLAAFHCDNPACGKSQRQILAPLSSGQRHGFGQKRMAAGAHPCSFCPGALPKRWALSFDGMVGVIAGPSAADNAIYMRLPETAPFTRASSRPGPMRRVAKGLKPRWGGCWDSNAVRLPSSELAPVASPPSMTQILALARERVENARAIAVALEPENIRALIDGLRQVPAAAKTEAMALLASLLFTPRRMERYLSDDDDLAEARLRHPYISMHPRRFLDKLRRFGCLGKTGKFLDVGSGIGEKPYLAYALGAFSGCDGLEVNQQSVAVADYLLACLAAEKPYPIRNIGADALQFEGYGDYEVIYLYRPFRDTAVMAELMRHIAAQIQPGTVVFDGFSDAWAFRCSEAGFHAVCFASAGIAEWSGPVGIEEILEGWGWT